ncbi:MAG: xylulokinase [Candidatus Latescibacter sp.]|nr:xylulokinase [Candidatus Latescibacter sp.]
MPRHLLGIDLGTSSVRAGIFREDGARIAIAARAYPIETPVPGASLQDPELWWRRTGEAIAEALALSSLKGSDISGISFCGQMHGAVLLDSGNAPVGCAVIWADSRSAAECEEITEMLGSDVLRDTLMNRIFPGTQAAIIPWLRKHEPEVWRKVRRILLPKDYLRFRMCGLFNSEPSDASATLLFDQNQRDWSTEVLKKLSIPIEFLPFIVASDQVIAETEGIEEQTGIPDGVPLVLGGADQAAAALGNAVLDEGVMFIAVGTGGQIVTPLRSPRISPGLCLNTFCHLPESRWYLMGATLAAGLSLRWFRDTFAPQASFSELDHEAAAVSPGCEGLRFAPYIAGKRSPMLDPSAAGSFTGIRLNHTRGYFARAVLEGVAFELRDSLDVIGQMGIRPHTVILSGGGAKSPLWPKILADVFDLPLALSASEEAACFGTALLAGVGVGAYGDYWKAAELVPKPSQVIEPKSDNVSRYEEIYRGREQ